MANPLLVTYSLVAAVANGIAQSQTPGGAGNLTLNGSLVSSGVATMDTARRVIIASAGADGSKVFTLTGTDRNGNIISESLTGVTSSNTVQSVLDYKTITKIAVSAGTAGAITVGTNGVGSTQWFNANFLEAPWNMSVACMGPAGTTYTVEHTYDDFTISAQNAPDNFGISPGSNVPPVAWGTLIGPAVSGNNEARFQDWPIFGYRLTINSGTGTVTMQTLQSGRGSGHA